MSESDESKSTTAAPLVVQPRPVGSLVARQAVEVATDASLRSAIAKLVDADVGVVLVADGDQVKGIVSERDLLDAVNDLVDLDAVLVTEMMQRDIITVDSNATVVDAARVMIDRGVRHVLVVGDSTGVVSIRAAMRSMLG